MNNTPTVPLVAYLQGIVAGEAKTHESLSIFPLFRSLPGQIEYLLLGDALETGQFEISELHETGSVPELKATNGLARPVLILDGEELVGAKQNRIANASFLVPGGGDVILPVSCVEQGRWAYSDRHFREGTSIYGAGARRNKYASVRRNLTTTGSYQSDQREVWRDVESYISSSHTISGSMAYSDYLHQRSEEMRAYEEQLPWQEGQVGQIVFLNELFLALDCLDRTDSSQKLYPKLLRSYAQEALDRLEQTPPARPLRLEDGASGVIERLWQMTATAHPSLGEGTDLRFEDRRVMGSALVSHEQLLHLEVFPRL